MAAWDKHCLQLCLLHQVRDSLYYVSWKQRKAVAADPKSIYQASTVEEAGRRLGYFARKLDASYDHPPDLAAPFVHLPWTPLALEEAEAATPE